MKFISHEDAYEVTTKNHNKVTVPANTLEFPQVEQFSEIVEFCGGEEKAVDLFNDLIYGRSKNGALAIVRNAAADTTTEDAIKRAADYAKTYNPAAERVSKQAILDGVSALAAMKEQLAGMSAEEIMAQLEKTLRI